MAKYVVMVKETTVKVDGTIKYICLEKEFVKSKQAALALKKRFSKKYQDKITMIFKYTFGSGWREI